VPPLRALVADGHELVIVVSQPDRKRGRGSALVASPVKREAVALGLPVTERVDDVIDARAELGVVVAFGRIIKPHVLAALPMVNVHFSLLPRWRGAAPVERAILAGDEVTGVCLMEVEEGLDTGGVYASEGVAIGPEETADELRRRLVEIGTGLLVHSLRRGLGTPVPQEGEATLAAKIDPAELKLDWSAPSATLHRVIRLGRAWTTFRGRRLLVLRAHRPAMAALPPGPPGSLAGPMVRTGDGALELVEVQPEGKGAVPVRAWLNGARPAPDERLGA
jgi:methionyl-tRNA formyltransferase